MSISNTKRCSKCRVVKPHSMFYRNATKKDGFKSTCKPCTNPCRKPYSETSEHSRIAKRAWIEANKDKLNSINRAKYAINPIPKRSTFIKWKYGMTVEQYEAMVISQNGLCAICNQVEIRKPMRRLAIDHCHSTGKIRGLLCSRCNTAIGQFGDNPSILKSAIEYLDRHRNE